MGITNALWTLYIQYVNNNKPWRAAGTGEVIFLIGAFTTLSYIHDHRLIIAAAIGGFVGTYLTVKYSRKKS